MRKVIVKKTENPEYGYNSKEQLLRDTNQHRQDVGKVLGELSLYLFERGVAHDWSKLAFFEQFSQDTLERQDTPDFKSRPWYKIHTTKERHHVNANVPEDVDLIDLLEMIVDCVVAGKTRSGEVNNDFLILNDNILEDAYWNTVKKITDTVIVEKEDDK